MLSASEIRKLLHEQVIEVVFKKKDGSERVMLCTLLPQFMPDGEPSANNVQSDDIITVWDIEVNGWRCFRMDSVISVDFDEDE